MKKRRLLLMPLPLVVLWTLALMLYDGGDNGKLGNHFLRTSLYPSLRRLEVTYTDLKFRARGPEPVHTFSIGFAEEGYDELEFARIAARECGAVPHTDRVDRSRTLATIPRLAELYDQPFGNASAVPTHACAALASQAGRSVLLAGDGGDEIFGGNERYAKDAVMERFHRLPGFVRAIARHAERAESRARV
jgi:asparagine synthase (glutamine-hydrolysing)